ncbi:hypothetical protein H6F95_21520 [Cyanobacteria bacterium FACHB-471]|nr:hypothetical protein [Cyanobacteria bacterium FACHB-471]
MTTNLNQATLSDSDKQDVMESIVSIHEKLSFLINLSQEERRSLPKMGDKTRIFVQKAMEVANRHDEFLPRSFDIAEMRRAVSLYESLYPILLSLGQLHELLEDTYYAAGNEAYTSARVVYQSAKIHGRGIGIDTVVEELGTRFSRKSRKSQSQPRQA